MVDRTDEDAWRSNGPGACGMPATLETVWLRQVLSLVLADGLTATGSECHVDGRLYPHPPDGMAAILRFRLHA
jgi:hypothetical protein